MSVSYDICCNEQQGRHLRARYDLSRNDLIFCERPMVVQQCLGLNTQQAWVCHACHGFVGNATGAMQHRFPAKSSLSGCQPIITACRQKCGHVYCNKDCEDAAWRMHHRFLCTGNIADDEEHPLILFKQLAVESNEILLLIAQWWILEHHEFHSNATHESVESKWNNFCMKPWWEVATLELEQQPGAFAETAVLNQSIRKLCQDAAEVFNQVLQVNQHAHTIPSITALDIAKRVGACEQNAIGIRQRHPLCREVFDRDFREMHHSNILQCLAEAGYIGTDDPEGDGQPEEQQTSLKDTNDTEWDYSVDEIAVFLSDLYIQEDGMVIDTAAPTAQSEESVTVSVQQGDDLDHMFPPLDGTAMYATACKMNHSCDPNVLLVYHSNPSWQRPLTLYALAIKDIQEEEELTISYIDHSNKSLQERQQALINYGFVCTCSLCTQEQDDGQTKMPAQVGEENDELFGPDASDEDEDDNASSCGPADAENKDSEQKFQACLERLDSIRNHVMYGATPLPLFAKASNFVTSWVHGQTNGSLLPVEYLHLLQQCVQGIEQRDFALMELLGSDLVSILYSVLQSENAWPNAAYRNAYWCAVIVAALGWAHRWCFLDALDYLDRGMVLGLPVRTDPRLTGFMSYIEHHAYTISELPVALHGMDLSPQCADPTVRQRIEHYGLSRPLQHPVPDDLQEPPFYRTFSTNHVLPSRPLVLRGFASGWSALSAWSDLEGMFGQIHGHRQIPVERGTMLANNDGAMQEEIISLRTLIRAIRSANDQVGKQIWSLQDAQQNSSCTVYLAQHPFLEQIPALKSFVDTSPPLCGLQGPTHTHVWLGSAGTRTPLHYDSYDSWLVQLVGAKYVRLYPAQETSKLYAVVSQTAGGPAQGNMSALHCEDEDWQQHPLAQDAPYTEVILYPGDGLYIPARMWHYVRSLTPSISVNFWF